MPRREVIQAFTMLDLRIEESQGFILPSALNANVQSLEWSGSNFATKDTSIRISSVNNIQRGS